MGEDIRSKDTPLVWKRMWNSLDSPQKVTNLTWDAGNVRKWRSVRETTYQVSTDAVEYDASVRPTRGKKRCRAPQVVPVFTVQNEIP